jgi:hypothetical protein
MPKAILEFDLPEENSEFQLCTNAADYYSALWELSQQIRQWTKYDNKESVSMEELSDVFYNIVGDMLD